MVKKDSYMWILPSIFILLFLFSVKFCTRKINEEYLIGKVERQDIKLFVTTRGEVEARNILPIGLDIELGVDDIYFKEGDYVKQGDLIIRFSGYQEEESRREIDDIKETLAVKSSKLRFAEERNSLSGDNNDEVQQLRGEISVLQSDLLKKQNLRKLIVRDITSPISGYIIKINAVKGGTNNPAKPLLILAKKSDIKIVTEPISKEKAELLKLGDTALVNSLNDPKNTFEAVLYKIDKSQGVELAGLELLTKDIENRYLQEILDIKIYYQKKESVMTIPIQALIKKEDKEKKVSYYIYTINKENKVQKRDIKTGISNGEIIEVKQGLEDGEEIILDPNKKLENNTIVKRKDLEKEKRKKEEELKKLKEKNSNYNDEIEKNKRKILKIEKEDGKENVDLKKEETLDKQQKPLTLEEMNDEDE